MQYNATPPHRISSHFISSLRLFRLLLLLLLVMLFSLLSSIQPNPITYIHSSLFPPFFLSFFVSFHFMLLWYEEVKAQHTVVKSPQMISHDMTWHDICLPLHLPLHVPLSLSLNRGYHSIPFHWHNITVHCIDMTLHSSIVFKILCLSFDLSLWFHILLHHCVRHYNSCHYNSIQFMSFKRFHSWSFIHDLMSISIELTELTDRVTYHSGQSGSCCRRSSTGDDILFYSILLVWWCDGVMWCGVLVWSSVMQWIMYSG